MTAEEMGGYCRLLFHQWDRGNLPIDPKMLARMTGVVEENLSMILEKFDVVDGGYLNARLEEERVKQEEFRAKQSVNGKLGGRPKKNPNETQALPKPKPKKALRLAVCNLHEEKKTPTPSGSVCERIYAEFPKKVGRGAAMVAIQKALQKVDEPTLLAAVKRFAVAMSGKEARFVPHPATWFNQERWEDDLGVLKVGATVEVRRGENAPPKQPEWMPRWHSIESSWQEFVRAVVRPADVYLTSFYGNIERLPEVAKAQYAREIRSMKADVEKKFPLDDITF